MTDNAYLLELLGDGRWHSLPEILRRSIADRGHGFTVHSRAADLRRHGHNIECQIETVGRRKQSAYRLVSLNEAEVLPARSDQAPSLPASASLSEPSSPNPWAPSAPGADDLHAATRDGGGQLNLIFMASGGT